MRFPVCRFLPLAREALCVQDQAARPRPRRDRASEWNAQLIDLTEAGPISARAQAVRQRLRASSCTTSPFVSLGRFGLVRVRKRKCSSRLSFARAISSTNLLNTKDAACEFRRNLKGTTNVE